jgi:hypothetical protein
MSKNNLQVINTGLDHCYINGVPIVEAIIDINDIFKKVARISSIAVQADPYFSRHTEQQKIFSELHGEGDRISMDFLEEGARELLPIFAPFQRFIPEGVYDAQPYVFNGSRREGELTHKWFNPEPDRIYVDNLLLKWVSGYGDVTIIVDGTTLGTVTLPEQTGVQNNFLAFDLAGYLGGIAGTLSNFDHSENIRNNNIAQVIEMGITNNSNDFVFDYQVNGSTYDGIGWVKALVEADDVQLPAINDNIRISYLITEFTWENKNNIKVSGVTLKHRAGSGDVTISYNETAGPTRTLDNNTVGDDYFEVTEDISTISIAIDNASDEFSYDLIINTLVPKILPSPRFEFNSLWNEGKIIYRYQNMDTRSEDQKLNYTSQTLRDIRVDPNIFEEVLKYLKDSLKNYILKELYEAIGYDKKAIEYKRKYEQSRLQAHFWVRSEKGLQTQYNYAGV